MTTPVSAGRASEAAGRGPVPKAWFVVSFVLLAASCFLLNRPLLSGLRVPTTFDDAYAFCRYADHLLAGQGLSWNPGGPRTYGCTSLLYVFWVAALKAATGLPGFKVLAVASWIPAVLSLVALALACRKVGGEHRFLGRPIVAFAFVFAAVCFQGGFRFHAATGMDTTTGILTNALLILAVAGIGDGQRLSRSRLVFITAAAYASFLARPDDLVFAAMFPVLYLLLVRRATWRDPARFVAEFGAVLAVDSVIKTIVFGHPLPLPFFVKSGSLFGGFDHLTRWNPVSFALYFLRCQLILILILTATVNRRSWRLVVSALAPAALLFVYFGGASQVMPFAGRFYYPALPFLALAAYASLTAADSRLAAVRPIAARSAVAVLILVAVFPLGALLETAYDRAYARASAPAAV